MGQVLHSIDGFKSSVFDSVSSEPEVDSAAPNPHTIIRLDVRASFDQLSKEQKAVLTVHMGINRANIGLDECYAGGYRCPSPFILPATVLS